MNKRMLIAMLTLAMALMSVVASAQIMYVDNRETDQRYPERLNLRAEPSAQGDLLGLYYSGTQVQALENAEGGYMGVEIAGIKGYMSAEYLITEEEAAQRYPDTEAFYAGRAAQVDISGLWMTRLPVYAMADSKSEQIMRLENGAIVELKGIIGDDWAYIACETAAEKKLGYVMLNALTDIDEYKALVIAGDKADSRLILYSWPSEKAKQIMSLKNGTACFNLFGRNVGGWRKVRVGGVTGWIRELYNPGFELLSETKRASIPYYPLLMQTKADTLLYSSPGDTSKIYMTLGRDMKVEVLAESEDYAFVRTYEGGAGAYDCGDYGYIQISDLSLTQTGTYVALAQVDDDDLPAAVLSQPDPSAELLGALCAGAQVRITDFTQTDYMKVRLGAEESGMEGYVLKSSLRMLTGEEGELSERIPQRASLIRSYTLSVAPGASKSKNKGMPELSAGERVYMLGVIDGWAYVRAAAAPSLEVTDDAQDMIGFIELDALNAPASTTHLTAVVTTDKVNMRQEGSASAGIVAKARLEERLLVADYGIEWTCVVKPDGKRGYLMTKYLDFEQD